MVHAFIYVYVDIYNFVEQRLDRGGGGMVDK